MPDLVVLRQRLLGRIRGGALQHPVAHHVPPLGRVGRARRFAAVVGVHVGRVGSCRGCVFAPVACRHGGPCAGCVGPGDRGPDGVRVAHVQPVRSFAQPACRRALAQPPAAGSRAHLSPPLAVHGVCGHGSGLCICHGRTDCRPAGCCLGALVASVDDGCLGVPDPGHCIGFVVGLLRTGLGGLVVLGPGGKRIFHALAGGHSAHPFAGRD